MSASSSTTALITHGKNETETGLAPPAIPAAGATGDMQHLSTTEQPSLKAKSSIIGEATIKVEPHVPVKAEPGVPVKAEAAVSVKVEQGVAVKAEPGVPVKVEPVGIGTLCGSSGEFCVTLSVI